MQQLVAFLTFMGLFATINAMQCQRHDMDLLKNVTDAKEDCPAGLCFQIDGNYNKKTFTIQGCETDLANYTNQIKTPYGLACPDNHAGVLTIWNREVDQYYNVNITCCSGNMCNLSNTLSYNLFLLLGLFVLVVCFG
uniref:UPAR/Ly6 domain-containing protein n=1 Tax=Acrobeloides nanus TaxID=290746 RepID=A0A914CU80_9BILA